MYLSQSKLSLLAGLGRITVHNIEERRTQGNVGIITVEKLAKILQVPPCWLAYGHQPAEDISKDISRSQSTSTAEHHR